MPTQPIEDTRSKNKKKLRKDILRLVGITIFFCGVAYVLQLPYVRAELFDIERLRIRLQGYSVGGILLFILAAAFFNALGVPRLWISVLAGSLYGAFEGSFYGFFASLAGASLNFLMGRSLLRGPIRRRMPKKLQKWYEAFNRNGFRAILYLRLIPFTNATLTNLICGASKITFKDYITASALGFFPTTLAMATLGSSAAKNSIGQMITGLAVLLLVIAVQWVYSRSKKSDIDG